MYIECRDYLVAKLKAAGIKSTVITNQKRLKLNQEPHVGAVLIESEQFDRSSAKKMFNDQTGARHKRRQLFSRIPSFSVIIGDPIPERTEAMFEAFLRSLDNGLYIDGNYTSIELGETEWVEEEDSILKSKLAVNIKVIFNGGVYKDSDFVKITDIEISATEKGD
jgi:hypothetical protein